MNRGEQSLAGDPGPHINGGDTSLEQTGPGDDVSTRIGDFFGEFLNRDLERTFLRSTRSTRIRHLHVVGLTAAVFIVLGIVVDVLVVGNDAVLIGGIIAARALVAASIIAGIVSADRATEPERSLDRVIVIPILLLSAMTCGIVWAIRGELLLHALTALVLILVYYLFLPIRLISALAISLVFTVSFIASTSMFLEIQPDEFIQVILYLTLANILGALISRERNATVRREFVVVESQCRIAD
ncbi:MAG: hypothetical protein KAJ78_01550, partial [Acidobacteria bacterium]|nr:hypothetical protein [Acidobacteriota bacterium]